MKNLWKMRANTILVLSRERNEMKRKLLSLLLSVVVLIGFSITVFADYGYIDNKTQSVEYYEDGSSLTITLEELPVLTRGTTFDKSGNGLLTFRDNDGNKMWEVRFYVTFRVNQGVSATCTDAYFTAPTIYDSTWRYVTNTVSKNGNSASGTITMKKYFMGLPVRTETPSITITCDNFGNLTVK